RSVRDKPVQPHGQFCPRNPSKAPRGDSPATTITSLHRGARGPFSTRVKDMTDQKDAEAPRGAHGTGISRRSLLAGTAGLTFAGALAGSTVQAIADHDHAHQSAAGGTTGSGRLYQVNPGVTDRADIAHNPADIPGPITRREPQTVRVELETMEIEAHLDNNATFRFWTFNGRVPGPFIRVRVGDTVECYFKNNEDSWMAHNVDFHA